MIDRRDEFKNKYWYVGSFIDSLKYKHWRDDDKERAIESEKYRVYINPLHDDQFTWFTEYEYIIKSRILIYVFKNKETCLEAVKNHNNKIREQNDRLNKNSRT